MDRSGVANWIASYERAWRSPGTDTLADLFAPDATYRQAPFRDPVVGLPAIEEMWEAERDGPDETFAMSSELIAVEGDTAVARIDVAYGSGDRWADLWLIRFGPDGRCVAFEEWPFAAPQ